jgi:hypothetical protein
MNCRASNNSKKWTDTISVIYFYIAIEIGIKKMRTVKLVKFKKSHKIFNQWDSEKIGIFFNLSTIV